MKFHHYWFNLSFTLLFLLYGTAGFCQAPAILWQKSYGGSGTDVPAAVRLTNDGGYIIAGQTNSNDGDVSGNHGSNDFWVVKIDSNGNMQWQECYGGSGVDVAYDVRQTTDGGYVFAGMTNSGMGGSTYHGGGDFWVVKTDSSGNIQWEKCYGGTQNDIASSILQSADGGYVIAGTTTSNDGDVTNNHSVAGYSDFWVVKTDSNGNIQWQKCYGGGKNEIAHCLIQTADKGYVVAGSSDYAEGDVGSNHGGFDYWIVKLDSAGVLEWETALGGSSADVAHSVLQTSDGGYIVAGGTASTDQDVVGNHQIQGGPYSEDYWIIKLDPAGGVQWKYCYGGSAAERAYTVIQAADGGYAVAGETNSINNGDVLSTLHGGFDYWILKLGNAGNIEWQNCYGGSEDDRIGSSNSKHTIEQTADKGYIVVGNSKSTDGDVTGNQGGLDYWIVRLEGTTSIREVLLENGITIYPSPSSGNGFYIRRDPVSALQEATVNIYSVSGQHLYASQIAAGESNIAIGNISLAPGLYLVRVSQADAIFTGKLVVR